MLGSIKRGVTMKKRGLYFIISLTVLLIFVISDFMIAFSGWSIFTNKDNSLNAWAIILLSTCTLFAVADIALFLLTKEGKTTIRQSLSQIENILVYLTAVVLITTLTSYCTVFCANTLERTVQHQTPHESIAQMISSI